jgi:hypothetical protein
MNLKLKGIRPYSKRELAALYDMPLRSFYTLLRPHHTCVAGKIGQYFSVLQVERIFERLSLPPCLLDDKFQILPARGSYIRIEKPDSENKNINVH